MVTSEAANPNKKCCISFLVSKLGAKLLYLHQLRTKQSYLQIFTNLLCSLFSLRRWDKYLDISYHKLEFIGPPRTVSFSWKQKLKLYSFNTSPLGGGVMATSLCTDPPGQEGVTLSFLLGISKDKIFLFFASFHTMTI